MPDYRSYRCTSCDTNWPVKSEYRQCPGCQEDTWTMTGDGARPITSEEARRRAAALVAERERRAASNAAFEAYLRDRAQQVAAARVELDQATPEQLYADLDRELGRILPAG
jgi:primosomal protein N'